MELPIAQAVPGDAMEAEASAGEVRRTERSVRMGIYRKITELIGGTAVKSGDTLELEPWGFKIIEENGKEG